MSFDRVTTLYAAFRQQCQRRRSRRRLAQLDPHLLDDIGISRATAEREARKPFWK
ncbi:DUF1127 domain-containing protein [Halomonas heilongjiangensis]|uniref:DUF1127 domain-containing protein n=1 Tax=Halomonas heilongjiangensis TaxID=1387883 RepID=A0A2N7TPN7_9GAMM|nr:DUF1127 domain-containing protein [Halomonas heilongjiangensis]PMR70146.1 DUF1127 domain-containing protein [Halomonas heilongjiangensis]PXX94509.1 DUF1127 domain-containing protein [Halomonas heilongjiangensis]